MEVHKDMKAAQREGNQREYNLFNVFYIVQKIIGFKNWQLLIKGAQCENYELHHFSSKSGMATFLH